MKLNVFSYRFAEEILQHSKHSPAWSEIKSTLEDAPLFIYPGKSEKNPRLNVLQQVMNTYFDRKFAIDLKWAFHPFATKIENSNLRADYRKEFNGLSVQTEIQFGNMARWYSDIFKFQAAYSEELIQVGVSIVPMRSLAQRIDSNVTHFERAIKELPSARLSITLPILLVGLEEDSSTVVTDVSNSRFSTVKEINGKGYQNNRWRLVNGYINGADIKDIGDHSEIEPNLEVDEADDD